MASTKEEPQAIRRSAASVAAIPRGFALVELAMLAVVVTGLALVSLPALLRHGQRAMQANCASRLRQVGVALELYTRSHHEQLPGPLFPVPRAGYDKTSRQELAWYIAAELGYPAPSKRAVALPPLICSLRQRRTGGETEPADLRSYVINENLNRRGEVRLPPFGSCRQPVATPLKMSDLAAFGAPARILAMKDADKANVNPTLACWRDLPWRPVHGQARTRLYFDGHVEAEAR